MIDRAPLAGRSIVVTRPRDQAISFVQVLEEAGASILVVPLIRIVDPPSPEPLLRAVREIGRYDWLVFTSANGVTRFWEALRSIGLDSRAVVGVSICAIGPATAAAVERQGARPSLMPDAYVAESVVEALVANGVGEGTRVLVARPEVAREILPESLRRAGARVDEVVAYRTVPESSGVEPLRASLEAGQVDVITFTSSSTVRSFAKLVSAEAPKAAVASIGPLTSAAARSLGWEVEIEAREHTTAGLAAAILEYFGDRGEA